MILQIENPKISENQQSSSMNLVNLQDTKLIVQKSVAFLHTNNKKRAKLRKPPKLPCGSDGKVSVYNAGDPGSIPGSGRSPGEGNGNPLQYYCLENPMVRGAWQATVHGVAKSQTRLSNSTFTSPSFKKNIQE